MYVERLGDHHRLDDFTSGVKSLDDWLKAHALENQRRDLSRTFVLVDEFSHEVTGYYSLTMGQVVPSELPRAYGRGLPDLPIGMVLLGRLAISETAQGEGHGRDLLVDAILQAVRAGEHAAARFITVDPIDDGARTFYPKFGFKDIRGDGEGRMYLRLKDAIAALQDW